MQWSKVKNILIVILLLIDGFLALSLVSRWRMTQAREDALLQDLEIILAQSGVACGEKLRVPLGQSAIALEIERGRAAEEKFASVLLSEVTEIDQTDDGAIHYVGPGGEVVWQADGSVEGQAALADPPDDSGWALRRHARAFFETAGVALGGATMTTDAENRTVTLQTTVAGLPVFGRQLLLDYSGDGTLRVTGVWTFETPYAAATEQARNFNAGDALLHFAGQQDAVSRIDGMELGYFLTHGGGRLSLLPCWKITTDQGLFFVDALKMTLLSPGNIGIRATEEV